MGLVASAVYLLGTARGAGSNRSGSKLVDYSTEYVTAATSSVRGAVPGIAELDSGDAVASS